MSNKNYMCVESSTSVNAIFAPTEVLIFPEGIAICERKLLDRQGREVDKAEALKQLTIGVGEEIKLSVVLVDKNGDYRVFDENDGEFVLRCSVDDYEIWCGSAGGLTILGREINVKPARLSVKIERKCRRWNVERWRAFLDVSVVRGYSFVLRTARGLNGIESPLWRYGRRDLNNSLIPRVKGYLYIIEPEGLSLHSKQTIADISYAYSDSLASGWEDIPLHSVHSSDDKAIVCNELIDNKRFGIKCRRKAGSDLGVEVVDCNGDKHFLKVFVLPEAEPKMWSGIREVPNFKTKRSWRFHRYLKKILKIVCFIVSIVWIIGCLLAQVQSRGWMWGTLYTAGALTGGLAILFFITLVSFVCIALTLSLYRRLQKG